MEHRQKLGCSRRYHHQSLASKERSLLVLAWIYVVMMVGPFIGTCKAFARRPSTRISWRNFSGRPSGAFIHYSPFHQHHYQRQKNLVPCSQSPLHQQQQQRWRHSTTHIGSSSSSQQGEDKNILQSPENNEDTSIHTLSLEIPTAQDTEEVGALFAAILLGGAMDDDTGTDIEGSAQPLPRGCTIFLDGDLGAGKTAFSRGFVRAATGDDDLRVTSPTYLLVNVYPILGGSLEIHHMDLYRLKGDPKDFVPLNLDTVFAQHVSLIEWPERLGDIAAVPQDRLDINIQILSDSDNDKSDSVARLMTMVPKGTLWENRLKLIAEEGYLDDLLLS